MKVERNTLVKIGKDYYMVNDDDTQKGSVHDVVNLTSGKEVLLDTEKDKFTIVCKIPKSKLEQMSDLVKLAITYQIASDYVERSHKILSEITDPNTIADVKNARDESQTAVDRIGEFFKNEYKINNGKEAFAYVSNMAKELEQKSKQPVLE